MTQVSEDWVQLQALFHLAEATPEEDRERVLSDECADQELRRRAMAIFRAANVEGEEIAPPGAPLLNGRIGPYSLIRHLGSGGIGSVYLVERIVGGAVQRSALKILAPHAAGHSFIERFRREQHILASLDHPNITRMLDAGLSESGQPYLVMEYVDGVHLDVYCDALNLGIPERLRLFLRVCDAVAYAHRNLVVHLDLKPSNILVTADGAVKLLDFGTSKLIQPDSLFTTTILATPAYASPEQLRNEPVTTVCDIYALGVILFELLAGRRPGDKASIAAMIERAMKEQEPERLPNAVTGPAAAHRGLSESRPHLSLSSDLATIVAKCLSPRPKDRYSSLDSLTGDILRFIDGRPVLARPQTALYRASKFVRRHRTGVVAALLASLLLIASLGYAEWRQRQALLEGQRAERMQTYMYRLFKLANSDYTGKPAATVPEFLELGVKMLPAYIKNPADLREAQMSMAESMFENGDFDSAQKTFAQTIASAKAAGDIEAEAESEAFSGNIAFQQGQVEMGKNLTENALRLSRKPGVSPAVQVWSAIYYAYNRDNLGFLSDEDLRLFRFAAKEARDHNLPPHETAEALYNLATDLEYRGRLDEAGPIYSEALRIFSQDPLAVCEQSEVYGDLGYLNQLRGNVQASLPLYKRSYDGYKTCSGAGSRGALSILAYMAGALIKAGRAGEAVQMLEASLPAWRKIPGSSFNLTEFMTFLSSGYIATGRYKEAENAARDLIAADQGKVDSHDGRLAYAHLIWAQALAGQHRYQEALPHAEFASRFDPSSSVTPTQAGVQFHADAHRLLLEIQANLPAK